MMYARQSNKLLSVWGKGNSITTFFLDGFIVMNGLNDGPFSRLIYINTYICRRTGPSTQCQQLTIGAKKHHLAFVNRAAALSHVVNDSLSFYVPYVGSTVAPGVHREKKAVRTKSHRPGWCIRV